MPTRLDHFGQRRHREPHAPALTRAPAPRRSSEISTGLPSRRQQRRLASVGVPEHVRVDHEVAYKHHLDVVRARFVHEHALALYRTGHHNEAMALNDHARKLAGLGPQFSGHQGVAHLLSQTARDLGNAAYYGIPGTGLALYGVGQDLAAGLGAAHGVRHGGDIHFRHTRAVGRALGQGIAQDVTHPLRHPGYTLLDVVAAASLGAGTAARGAAAGRAFTETAARAGTRAGVRAALTRPGFEGGSLLHRPPPGEIELAPGVHILEPDSPLARPFVRARVRRLQARLEHPDVVEARTAPGRLLQKTIGPENVIGRQLRAQYRIPRHGTALAKRVAGEEAKLGLPERTATRLVLIEGNRALRDPGEVVARHAETHRQWAEQALRDLKPTASDAERRHAADIAKTNEQVAQDIEAALPVLSKPERPFLEHVARTRMLSRRAEREAIAREDLAPEQAAQRKANMARLYRGGKSVTEPSRRARAAHIREYPGRLVTERQLGRETVTSVTRRPRTEAEAQRRIAELDRQLNAFADEVAQRSGHPFSDPQIARQEQLRRNRINGLIDKFERTGGRSRGTAKALRMGRQLLVREELHGHASDLIAKIVAANPDEPAIRNFVAMTEERNRLAEAVGQRLPGEDVVTGGFGTVRQIVTRPGEPAIVERTALRRGRRVNVTAQEARRTSRRFEGGVGPEGFAAPRGSAYFPSGEAFKQLAPPETRGAIPNTILGPYGKAEPDVRRGYGGTLRRFTGKSPMQGVVEKPGQAIARRYLMQHRLYSAQDLFEHARELGSDRRVSMLQVPLRNTRGIPQELRAEVDAELEKAAGGDANALSRAGELLRSGLEHKDAAIQNASIGSEIEGVRWVDRRMLKELTNGQQGKILKGAAVFNRPFRFFGVYLRPAYFFTNYPQNASMALIEQGILRGTRNLVRARRANGELGPDLVAEVEHQMGTSRTGANLPRQTRGMVASAGRLERKGVEFLTHITDRDMRLAAWFHRAEERGFRSPAELNRLIRDPANRRTLEAVTRRARRDAVDFDSLTPFERELVDAVYFYPWMSRASAWSARVVVNHPLKAAAAAQFGKQAKEAEASALGPFPGWMKGYIATRFGLVNTVPLNTPATPAQIGDYVAQVAGLEPNPHQSSLAENFGTPILQAIASGNPNVLGELAGATAPGYLLKRAGVRSKWLGKPSKTFPETGPAQALGPFTFGGSYPRHADLEQVHKQAAMEMPSPQRFTLKMHDLRRALTEAVPGHRLPPQLDAQLRLHHMRYVAYRQAGIKTSDSDYQQRAAAVDFELLGRRGIWTKRMVAAAKRAARALDADQLKVLRRDIGKQYFPTDWLNAGAKIAGATVPR